MNEEAKSNFRSKKDPKFTRTIRDDWSKVKLKDSIGAEYKDLKEYYLTEERKKKLEKMWAFRKLFVIPYWIIKALFFKLTPIRRILVLTAIILILLAGNNKVSSGEVTFQLVGTAFLGGLILLFILALELKEKLTAKTELEEGRAIQRALIPESNPKVEGWDIWLYTQPANEVGGDLLDFIQLREDKYGISVGDVAGKGLSAALMMAKLQSTIRAIITDFDSLSGFAEKLNKIFCRDSISKIFASLVYLEIQPNKDEVNFLNAGHFPPVILRNKKISRLKKDAPALGLLPNAAYHPQNVKLTKNDFLLIYSDGVTEARNEKGEFNGEENFFKKLEEADAITSEELGSIILKDVKDFAGNADVHDDLTLAILKRV
jgi:hypothetical protein